MAQIISGPADSESSTTDKKALFMITGLFFSWGFITSLNDILIPHLKNVFTLNYTQAMLVQFTFFGAYFFLSLPSGYILSRTGYKNGMITGLLTTGTGALLFYPAAQFSSYPFFLCALFILASGITILQVAANPYVSVLGPSKFASSRLNLAQAFNSLGTTLAPWFGAFFLFSSHIENIIHTVEIPYIGIAIFLFLLSCLLWFFPLPEIRASGSGSGTVSGALKHPQLLFGVISIFLYVGGEVSVGSFIISYLKDPEVAGLNETDASRYVSLYWGLAMAGRFAGAIILRKMSPQNILVIAGIAVILLLTAVANSSGIVVISSIVLIGFFNSVMFPVIFTLAVRNLGTDLQKGSSLLIMAIVGGAVIPVIMGFAADLTGLRNAFYLPVICYLFITFYGLLKVHRENFKEKMTD